MPDNSQKPLILLATDSPNRAKLVSKHLAQYFNVMTAGDADAAWQLLVEDRGLLLLICDLGLTMDQFGLLERLRNAGDSRLAATPVLLLVAENDTDSERESAFQMGATDFINLPFSSAELDARARLHANLYQQHAQAAAQDLAPVSAVNLLQQLSQQNFFNSRVQQEMSFSLRHRSNFSLCKLRLDNVKRIIAGFDKSIAITVVNTVAKIVQQTLRREDTLCYLGNAEFSILYPATNGINATTSLKRILGNIEQGRIRIAGEQLSVTLSAAVYSCVATGAIDSEQIFEQLDDSLKLARTRGGNQVVSVAATGAQRELSIDHALKLIAAGKTEELKLQAASLLQSVLPIIEFTDEVLQCGLDSVTRALRQQLDLEASAKVD